MGALGSGTRLQWQRGSLGLPLAVRSPCPSSLYPPCPPMSVTLSNHLPL